MYIISNDKKKESAEELYSKFNDKDIEVIIDDVKGSIGEKIRKALIKEFKNLTGIKNASDEELKKVLPEEVVKSLREYLKEVI